MRYDIHRLRSPESLERRLALSCTPVGPDIDDQICESIPTLELSVETDGFVDEVLDVDMFRISAVMHEFIGVDIDIDPADSDLDSFLRLFDQYGNEMRSNDDGEGPGFEGGGGESYLKFVAPYTGDYFVGVSTAGNEGYSATTGEADASGADSNTGKYRIHTYDNDPNDFYLSARPLPMVPTSYEVEINAPDMLFYFDLTSDEQVFGIDVDILEGRNFNVWCFFGDAFNEGVDAYGANRQVGPEPEYSSLEPYFEFGTDTYFAGSVLDSVPAGRYFLQLPTQGPGTFELNVTEWSTNDHLTVNSTGQTDIFRRNLLFDGISLEEAIRFADAKPGHDEITFDEDVFSSPHTIEVFRPFQILDEITISGPGRDFLTIDGRGVHGIFEAAIRDLPGIHFSNMTLANGNGNSDGGAIYSRTTPVTVNNMLFRDNRSDFGGAIFSGSTLTISNSEFTRNTSISEGGAVYAEGEIHIDSSEFRENQGRTGGAVFAYSNVDVANSHFERNVAGNGGAIASEQMSVMNISGSRFLENSATYSGGAIFMSHGVIQDSVVSANWANDGGGIGVYDRPFFGDLGVLIAGQTRIENNRAVNGGGISSEVIVQERHIRIEGSTKIRGNVSEEGGGGLYLDHIWLEVVGEVEISGNRAGGDGGGIYLDDSSVDMTDTRVTDNLASGYGGGIHAEQTWLNTNSIFVSNNQATFGGGISIFRSPFLSNGTSAVIRQSSVSRNTAALRGGSIFLQESITEIVHSTLSGNQAFSGGAIFQYSSRDEGDLLIENSTIAQNRNGAVNGVIETLATGNSSATIRLRSTLVANNDGLNTLERNNNGGDASIVSEGYNISDDDTGDFSAIGDQPNTDPLLSPLQDNGGDVLTHTLAIGSPAINAGWIEDPTLPEFEFDQRGSGFSRVVGGAIDVGSVEVQVTSSLDINDDGSIDGLDIDLVQSQVFDATGGGSASDLNGDGAVTLVDRDLWLVYAGAAMLPDRRRFVAGDANLDGFVDVSDLNVWNTNKFTATTAWTAGDFNIDGFVDVSDRNLWNANRFQTGPISRDTFGLAAGRRSSILPFENLSTMKSIKRDVVDKIFQR